MCMLCYCDCYFSFVFFFFFSSRRRHTRYWRDWSSDVCSSDLKVSNPFARDLQRADEQWTRAKGFDTFCPIGPRVVPVDPRRFDELEVFCRVNGKERQHGRAPDMVFSILALVSFVSQVMTLEPGDLIATGTPAGVGRLAPGDVVEVEIPGVGVLRNPVVAEKR